MKCVGIGRFVVNPTVTETTNSKVCRFALCVDEVRKVNGERKKFPHFFDFVVWDKAADVIAKYGSKGAKLYFEATPRQEKWVDNDGNNRSKIIFRLDDFQLLDYKQNDDEKANKEVESDENGGTEEIPF